MKLGRKCQLSVEVLPEGSADAIRQGSASITIPEELTIEFEISRQAIASSQWATFKVFNLGQKTRNLIYKDPYALTEYRAVQFRAGYESDPFLPLCFNGFITSAFSYRDGVNFITEITCYDGGLAMANGTISTTLVGGATLNQILRTLSSALPNLPGSPVIGNFIGEAKRGVVLFGNTWNLLIEASNGLATIDNGQVKILNYNEAIDAGIPLLNSTSGLLGSPRRSATKLEFDMLFEPRLTVGQFIELESRSQRIFNGEFKVMGFTHRGTISPAVAGDCQSTVSLFIGQTELTRIQANLVQ